MPALRITIIPVWRVSVNKTHSTKKQGLALQSTGCQLTTKAQEGSIQGRPKSTIVVSQQWPQGSKL